MSPVSHRVRVPVALGLTLLALSVVFVGVQACGTAPQAIVIEGSGVTDNVRPTLEIISPVEDLTVSRGTSFVIEWKDSDRDDSALISFALVNTATNEVISLVENIQENDDQGPDKFSVRTNLVTEGEYFLRGTISDGNNVDVQAFATTFGANSTNVRITIAPRGQGPPSLPPQLVVVEPRFNQSVAETDLLIIRIQPTSFTPIPNDPNNPPFDGDSNPTLYILLDTDDRPDNDDPANPGDGIIVLRTRTINQGDAEAISFNIVVDLDEIPPPPDGRSYFIRATIDDGVNPRVHAYAPGAISVVRLASGTVDLAEVGKTLSGVRFYGFNPGANLGSSMSSVSDFDADGVDDFVLVAQFGNPRNFGLVGEAYLIYGQKGTGDERAGPRFGGSIAVNSVSEAVSGVIFEGPPVRAAVVNTDPNPSTNGITDVTFIRDLTADGRPEIIFGLSRVNAAFDSTDYDPGDDEFDDNDPTKVEMIIRQGGGTVSFDDGTPFSLGSGFYSGTDDLTISSCTGGDCPNGSASVANGSSDLFFNDNGAEDRQWILIKFSDIRGLISGVTDRNRIEIPDLKAELSLRIFNRGGGGSIFECLTPFTEQTTFNTFAVDGGAPVPDVDYVATDIGGEGNGAFDDIPGDEATIVTVNVSTLVQSLLEGDLVRANNELRFIIVPTADFSDPTGIRSSEGSSDRLRPTLTINYEARNEGGALGCYPDRLVNNVTTQADRRGDVGWYGGGMAVTVNSTNRDNDGPINVDRLENTVVSLELVGQDGLWILDELDFSLISGTIFARADNDSTENVGSDPQVEGRIAGSRLVAGFYDFIDHRRINAGPRAGLFGAQVASIGDMNQDGLDEIIISAPTNEPYIQSLRVDPDSTHLASTGFFGSISVIQGQNYYSAHLHDKSDPEDSAAVFPKLDQQTHAPFGGCTSPDPERHIDMPLDTFDIFAERRSDRLQDGQSAGDINLDGVPDILCGAPRNDHDGLVDSGAVYIIQGRNAMGNVLLSRADDPFLRPPMVRIRGANSNDQIGHAQSTGLDINGDRLDDIFIASPFVDFEPVTRSQCAADYNRDGVIDTSDLVAGAFSDCRRNFGSEVFTSDRCKAFDYDNDSDIDEEDEAVFNCLQGGGNDCCAGKVDNGYIGVIFGGITADGDFDINDVATPSLPGTIFYGGQALDRAGMDVSSAGDFNEDGFGDILVTAPGRIITDPNGRKRKGVVYLIFGGTHLQNRRFSLDLVGTPELPGIVFFSPYLTGRPNEAAPDFVALIGDINNDGFDDIAIGNTKADFVNLNFPQGPNAPVDDAGAGRRRDTGDVYIIYGNNFGTNRGGRPRP